MLPYPRFSIRPALLAAIALAGCHLAQAETLEGLLERGPSHSVIWLLSPESGDLIGNVFANDSQPGHLILQNCRPDAECIVEGARTTELPEALTEQLDFSDHPSGWWFIEQARSARAPGGQTAVPQTSTIDDDEPADASPTLATRFGELRISDDNLLLLNDRPVLANLPRATPEPAPATQQNTAPAPPTSWLDRLATWWRDLRATLTRKVLALLGRDPGPPGNDTPATAAITPETPAPIGTAEVVQGNNLLSFMHHAELQDRDIVLLQNTGGTACPALYRFATLSRSGIHVTPEFGTCSDLVELTQPSASNGFEPRLSMPGYAGPFEPEAERERAARQIHHFTLRNGQVLEIKEKAS